MPDQPSAWFPAPPWRVCNSSQLKRDPCKTQNPVDPRRNRLLTSSGVLKILFRVHFLSPLILERGLWFAEPTE
jgi:hypothetical protein